MLYSRNPPDCFPSSLCDSVARLRQSDDECCVLCGVADGTPFSWWVGRSGKAPCTWAAQCQAVSSAPVACRRTVCIPNTSATVTPTAKSGTTHTHMTVSSTSGLYYNPKPTFRNIEMFLCIVALFSWQLQTFKPSEFLKLKCIEMFSSFKQYESVSFKLQMQQTAYGLVNLINF